MRVALDTNIVLSGLFFNGNERRILELALAKKIRLVLSETVIRETANNLQKKFSGSPESGKAKRAIQALVDASEVVGLPQAKKFFMEAKTIIRHENDAPVLAACMHAQPDCLITGDQDFFHLKKPVGFRILTARQFLDGYSPRN